MIECSCIECGKLCNSKGVRIHYNISHTEEGRARHKISSNKGSKAGAVAFSEKRKIINAVEKEKYNLSPKKCVGCHKNLPFDKKVNTFCNSSCAASYNMAQRIVNGYSMSKEARARHRKAAILHGKKRKDAAPKYTKISICTYCRCYFPYTNKEPRDTCSDICLTLKRSSNARNNPGLGTKRSKQEIQLYELCLSIYPNALPNHVIADGWDADIALVDYKIAILWNGPWHYQEMNIGNHSLKQVQNRDKIKTKLFTESGWKVIIYEDRYWTPSSAFENLQSIVHSHLVQHT